MHGGVKEKELQQEAQASLAALLCHKDNRPYLQSSLNKGCACGRVENGKKGLTINYWQLSAP